MSKFYEWLTKIGSLNFDNKSVLVIGGSDLVNQYLLALSKLNVKDITVIAETGKKINEFCKEIGAKLYTGGFEENLAKMNKMDLVIVAPPLSLTISATKLALEKGQTNILIEKPGSIYPNELLSLSEKAKSQTVKVAYNRLVYPNFHKLKELVEKEGGITSSRFTFTERVSKINFEKDEPEVYRRWGISNSLHVITMAIELIGMPHEIYPFQYGSLDWHKAGSIFVGTGISEKKIPFSYHADWGSGGRWGVEVNSRENSYQLIPLEEIYSSKKDTGTWNKIPFESAFPDIKQGIAEEIAIMLNPDDNKKSMLPSLETAAEYVKLSERIFGYTQNV